MTKNIFISMILFGSLSFMACQKERSNQEQTQQDDLSFKEGDENEVITSPPNSFESKAVIEMFGGEWCDACPPGVNEVKRLVQANPDKVYGAIFHYQDAFETINYNSLTGHLGGVGSFPSAAINRVPAVSSGDQTDYTIFNKEHWSSNLSRLINKKTNIGLAIETKINPDDASIKVLINGNNLEANKEYRLTLYIIEDNVPSIDQKGADASYVHQMMLRGSLTSATGDKILLKNYETLVKNFTLNLKGSTFVTENLKILCLVNAVGGNTLTREIVNAQQVKLGKTANWD